jgi:mycothiol system anti-sigma-R factor
VSDPTHPDGYTCEQAFSRLYEYLDRVLTADEDAMVRQHLAVCEDCVRHFHFEEKLLDTIREKCRTGRAPETLRRKIESLLDQL